jgi:hypothetical protein
VHHFDSHLALGLDLCKLGIDVVAYELGNSGEGQVGDQSDGEFTYVERAETVNTEGGTCGSTIKAAGLTMNGGGDHCLAAGTVCTRMRATKFSLKSAGMMIKSHTEGPFNTVQRKRRVSCCDIDILFQFPKATLRIQALLTHSTHELSKIDRH